mmetsp:Transcript_10408/g.22625  ORF Transcript_10408/g.22625 Transcript_10408/m.22625 type:complete len:406 (+) Transcript_10408:191-1408(+)
MMDNISPLLDSDLLIEMSQRLGVMRAKELSQYAVPDYLGKGWLRRSRDADTPDGEDDPVGAAEATPIMAAVPSLSLSGSSSAEDNGDDDSRSASSLAPASSSPVNKFWRDKICEWCYNVVDHYDFNREVVSVAMSYLDRYLATTRAVTDRRIFQLAAMTALYLAIKMSEPTKLHISSLIELGRGFFAAEHIVSMEQSMLETLEWHVHPPTPAAFCRDLLHLVPGEISSPVWNDMSELAQFLTELSVGDYWFVTMRPSSIALASIINAMELQGPQRIDPKYKADFLYGVVRIGMDIANDGEIIECYERLRELYIAGGYAPNQQHAEEGSPSAIISGSARVAADAEVKEAGVPRVVVVRAVSPNAIVSESPIRSRKREIQTSTRRNRAKRARKKLSTNLNEDGDNLS